MGMSQTRFWIASKQTQPETSHLKICHGLVFGLGCPPDFGWPCCKPLGHVRAFFASCLSLLMMAATVQLSLWNAWRGVKSLHDPDCASRPRSSGPVEFGAIDWQVGRGGSDFPRHKTRHVRNARHVHKTGRIGAQNGTWVVESVSWDDASARTHITVALLSGRRTRLTNLGCFLLPCQKGKMQQRKSRVLNHPTDLLVYWRCLGLPLQAGE